MKASSPAKKTAGAKKRVAVVAKRPADKKTAAKKSVTKAAKKAAPVKKKPHAWMLRLYVAGQTPKSLAAFSNLKRMCEQHLTDQYEIEVIDLIQQPHLASTDQIVALPTLVRRLPAPIKRVVGDLSNTDRVLVGMDLVTAFQ